MRSEISSVDPKRPLSNQQVVAPNKKPRRRLRARYKVLFVAIALVLAAFTFLLYMSPANKTCLLYTSGVLEITEREVNRAAAYYEGKEQTQACLLYTSTDRRSRLLIP